MTQKISLTPRQKDDFRRMFTLYLSKTMETKKDHHMASLINNACHFSIEFTFQDIGLLESNISPEEASELIGNIGEGCVTPDLWEYIVKSIEFYCKDKFVYFLAENKKAIFIISKTIKVIFIQQEPKSYEATIAGATVQ